MDKWLANLQKIDHPLPVPRAAGDADLFTVLFPNDHGITVETMSKVFDDGVLDQHDAISGFLKAQEHAPLGIPAAFSAPHEDGIEIERAGQQLWKNYWNGGRVAAMEVSDADDVRMYFDGHGQEISEAEHAQLVKGSTAKAAAPVVEPVLSKIAGLADLEE